MKELGYEQLTLFQEDFPASHSALPGSELARMMTVSSGRKCSALYESSDQLGFLVKMCLESSIWHSTRCFLTWKTKDTKFNRLLFQLAVSMPRTEECVVYGKGGKERTVYFGDVTAMYLKEYFDKRKDGCEALFSNRFGKPFQPDGVRVMLNKLAKAAGVKHVHPHKFRRTLATNFAKHGMPVQEIAAILGHDKIDTTMEYVMLDQDDTRNSYRKYA